MMKTKMTQWVLAATLTFCGAMMMLTSCTDAIGSMDNPVNPEQPVNPADELSKETFFHEDWMDRSVKPGDSFWNFCIGGWLKTRDAKDLGTTAELANAIKAKLDRNIGDYDSPVAGKLFKLLTQPAPEKSEEIKVLNDFFATLKLDGDVSKADLIRNFGKLYDIGCPALVTNVLGPINGQIKCILGSGIPFIHNFYGAYPSVFAEQDDTATGNNDSPVPFVLGVLMGLDLDSPEVKAKADDLVKIEKDMFRIFFGSTEKEEQTGVIQFKQMEPATLQSLNARSRGEDGEDLKAVFNEAFHVGEATYVHETIDEVLALLDEYSTDTWLFYMQYYVYGRFSSMLRYAIGEIDNPYDNVKSLAPSATIDFEAATLMDGCDVEGCREILEDMRQRMSQRIEQLDWLSSATKAKALEKMQAMVFSVGKPDHLYNADFKLTGNTAIEAAMQYMRQFTEYQRSLDGKTTYGNGWDYLAGNTLSALGLASTNAFYIAQFNQLFIIPAFTMPEIFPKDKDNAQRYAVAVVFGHELTHGFDPDGAKCDAHGFEKNWWAEEDMANFKLLQQKMIDRYNELEQAPGVMADGEMTLNENVADLGGMTLAYDLWNEKLQANGLSGQQLRHQQRQFFVSYADVWKSYKTDAELISQKTNDKHSAAHNRVNGLSRLFDDWYTLFGVEPGDKHYLKPADRVKIW
jgi:hypothetical protein